MRTDLVIGFTGSPAGRDAVALGRRLALATGARPTVVHVRPPKPVDVNAPDGWSWGASVAATGSAPVLVERCVAEGDVDDEIARHSDDADLLVIGAGGYGPLRRALLRGAAGRIVRAATCPVLVVPRGVPAAMDDPVVPLAAAVGALAATDLEAIDG